MYFSALAAAKDAGIQAIELQHGAIHRYHNHYCWEQDADIAYYPNELWCFGQSWIDQSYFPANLKAKIYPAQHMLDLKKRLASVTVKPNQVLVVSQKIVGIPLFQFTVELARLRPDLTFVIKLHPAERYQDLLTYADGMVPENLRVAEAGENTYQLMAESKFQLGVSSTTLTEGLVFVNRVAIVPLPTFEYMDTAIVRKDATLTQTPSIAASKMNDEMDWCKEPE
ncbi:MAG: hypothetical protein WBC71_04435, partial [Salaquimonas sp.]